MFRLLVALSFLLLPLSASAATLTRTGATDVNVSGTFYNVEFLTGTCAAIFSGCDDASDFGLDATSIFAAVFALETLINNTPDIDADISITGCSETRQRENCQIVNPYAEFTVDGRVKTARIENYIQSEDDSDGSYFSCCVRADTDLSNDLETYARWTLSSENPQPATVVPLPASALLMITAFGGLIGGARLSRQRKNT
ncbi:VPLPA-CTERM sorting domain-containing protein [uncultured Roseovarius sp.]|uniref:VPLPA-CTERM sorting domain-containing protein n=1 Tax=uncultured Roseovarius sp. TaxID=293344 RepID=UPI002623CDB9|nr:VPLPA-CTERM sorting domain-containing protein [uncultured Roseovarius sp.]